MIFNEYLILRQIKMLFDTKLQSNIQVRPKYASNNFYGNFFYSSSLLILKRMITVIFGPLQLPEESNSRCKSQNNKPKSFYSFSLIETYFQEALHDKNIRINLQLNAFKLQFFHHEILRFFHNLVNKQVQVFND